MGVSIDIVLAEEDAFNHASSLMVQGNYQPALPILLRIIMKNPTYAEAYGAAWDCCEQLRKHEMGKKIFDRALYYGIYTDIDYRLIRH